MDYFLIAGEASGDLHASKLMCALRELDPEAHFAYMGGERMRAVGGRCVQPAEEMAYMGLVDVVKHYPEIRRGRDRVREALRSVRPDVVICVDYGTFCLRYILPFVRRELPETKIVYFIPPKVWAWKQWRVRQLRRDCDLVLCIFPFEIPFFRTHGLDRVTYVGNPTYEEVVAYLDREESPVEECPTIALLSGSRRSEVEMNLPIMLEAIAPVAERFRPVIAGVETLPDALYREIIDRSGVAAEVRYGETYRILRGAEAALVTSGTATLETSLLGTPQVVCYATRAGRMVNYVFDHLFSVPYISLVNLIAGREVVPELFGGRCRVLEIRTALLPLLSDTPERREMLEGYDEVRRHLATDDAPASRRAAEVVCALLERR